MEIDRLYVYGTAGVIVALVLSQIFRKGFDPFAPIWLFLTGYAQVYVIQAISYRDYALRARGIDVTTLANSRAFWALLWFLAIYYSGLGKLIARRLPKAPSNWSQGMIMGFSPLLIAWGLACAGLVIAIGRSETGQVLLRPEQRLWLQFPTVQLVAAILLIVTGRQPDRPRPILTWAGILTAVSYTLIWMFFGRRSHALFGILTAVAAYYLPRYRRPSLGTLGVTALAGCVAVTLALGWRNTRDRQYEKTVAGFIEFAGDFDPSAILVNLNIKEPEGKRDLATLEATSRETEEYCGYLLMLDTVPHRSAYDYGSSYLRLFSTYIPRFIWKDKPYFGREQWISAWIAGSEFARKNDFTGPAISILGAAQLNGGFWGTLIVMGSVSLLIRTAYDYFRYHAASPWAQAWWALTYYSAWLMTVNDDPFVWFYYLYGHTTLPPLAFLWLYHRFSGQGAHG
ncbi:hypothetical protein BH23PLA1_BH23PLA1_03760 [soil metagenome]